MKAQAPTTHQTGSSFAGMLNRFFSGSGFRSGNTGSWEAMLASVVGNGGPRSLDLNHLGVSHEPSLIRVRNAADMVPLAAVSAFAAHIWSTPE